MKEDSARKQLRRWFDRNDEDGFGQGCEYLEKRAAWYRERGAEPWLAFANAARMLLAEHLPVVIELDSPFHDALCALAMLAFDAGTDEGEVT
jgi:hypothetical protein